MNPASELYVSTPVPESCQRVRGSFVEAVSTNTLALAGGTLSRIQDGASKSNAGNPSLCEPLSENMSQPPPIMVGNVCYNAVNYWGALEWLCLKKDYVKSSKVL